MRIEEMADVFLNSANFAPPSGYALNLKAMIKVSKVSWTSQLSYEILRSSFERKFDKENFISPKRTPPKSPGLLGLKQPKIDCLVTKKIWINTETILKLKFGCQHKVIIKKKWFTERNVCFFYWSKLNAT